MRKTYRPMNRKEYRRVFIVMRPCQQTPAKHTASENTVSARDVSENSAANAVRAREHKESVCPPENAPIGRSGWETLGSVLALVLVFILLSARHPASERAYPNREAQSGPGNEGASALPVPPVVSSLIGKAKQVKIASPTSLLAVARSHNTDTETLSRLNHLSGAAVRRGQTLRLPSQYILPYETRDGLVLNIPERGVYVFRKGHFVGRYPVAIGMRTWETPIGRFRLVRKVINPTWIPPKVMVEREGISTADVPPGDRNNPLGDRWMGWSAPEVGFHSTFAVDTVGHLASHACVRMYPEAAHHLYNLTYLGMPIYAVYEPIKLGKSGSDIYLSVSPDVYHLDRVSLQLVKKRLKRAGVGAGVNWPLVRQMLARQDGCPRRIAALPETPQRVAADR